MSLYASVLVTVFLFGYLVDAKLVPSSEPFSFAKWDGYLHERHRRSNPSEWQMRTRTNNRCTLLTIQQMTMHDALGRRQSGLLADPDSQGNCGSCWAFSSTHAYTDHLSITNGRRMELFSRDYPTRCNTNAGNGNGCCGASPAGSIGFLIANGAVSQSCLPYTLDDYPPREITAGVTSPAERDRIKVDYKRRFPLTCPMSCDNSATFNPSSNRPMSYQILSSENEVIGALSQGPVIVSMKVEANFGSYLCGVYCGTPYTSSQGGGHSVEIVDYSSPLFPGTPYFVVKNSWGTNFGEGGYFRIARNQGQLARFVALGTPGREDLSSIPDCSAEDINEPNNNEVVQIGAEFGVEYLTNTSQIRCNDNSAAKLSLISIVNGTIQIVEGFMLDVAVRADVLGCEENFTATILLSILFDEDTNAFTLQDYSYDVDNGSFFTKTSYFFVLVLFLVIFIL